MSFLSTTCGIAIFIASAAFGARAEAQTAASRPPHLVVIRLVEDPTSKTPYAFAPSDVTLSRGDTLRFLQVADTPHNVRFTSTPPGVKLRRVASPMLMKRGDQFELVIDAHFLDGVYAFVCDPHAALGMKGTLTVVPRS